MVPVPSATDNCSNVTVTHDATFPITTQGTTVITWTYTDENGNYSTQTQNIIINDTTAPVADATSLSDILAGCSVSESDIPVPSATDNCWGTVTITNDGTFPITVQGTTVITWTYTDENGNFSTQTQNVIINDTTAPIADATSLSDILAGCSVSESDIPVPSATDNCSNVTVTHDATFPITAQGTTVITWTYTDESGNYSTQTQNVVISDSSVPTPDLSTLMDITAQCIVLESDVTTPTATNICGGTVTTTSNTIFPITAQGTTVITWTYTDENGNFSTQMQNVIINDTTAPIADATSLSDILAGCSVSESDIPVPSATDNCSNVTVTHDATFPITAQGTTVITWTYTDESGNYSTQTQNVVISDSSVPTPDVSTLADILAGCSVSESDMPVPSATDNCSNVTVTHDATFPITAQGTTVIIWTYTDQNGNYSTQTQNVIINDTTAPVADATSLADILAGCSVSESDIPVPSATDNCSNITVTHDATFPITAQGTTVIIWTYTDQNGNYSTQTQNVIINDTTAPVADATSLADILAGCSVSESDIPVPSATDNCSNITVTHDATFPITSQGTTVITWTYTDENGNYSTQTQNVIINDTTAPVVDATSLSDILAGCSVSESDIPVPSATDNCSNVTVTHNTTFPITAQATTVIIWTYTDESGNFSTQTQNVIISESAINTVTFTDASLEYNTNAQYITVANLPTGATTTYTISPDTGLNNGAIDAGTYIITAVVSPAADAPNCVPVTLTATLTIEQASQEIIFDDIPVKQLAIDPDFQLMAYSTSGLPIYYTYTYNVPNPPATISTDGWVTMLTSGLVDISAHQDGNSNYLPATSVMQELEITSNDATIHTITIDEEVYENPLDELYHLMNCESSADFVTVNLVTEPNAIINSGHTFTIATPQPGIYTEQVTVTSQDGTTTKTYTIVVEKMFRFFDIVIQKFDNVLLANNNPETNGGYSFIAYEWYKNDELISTGQYFSEGPTNIDLLDPTALYYLRLTTTDGTVLQTCVSTVNLYYDYSLTVIPNPVITGSKINVLADFPKEELNNMIINIYDLQGRLVYTTTTSERITEIKLSDAIQPAPYLVKCNTLNYQRTFKIIVH